MCGHLRRRKVCPKIRCVEAEMRMAAYLVHTGKLEEFGSRYTARQGMEVGRDGRVAVRVVDGAIEIGGHTVTCVEGRLYAKDYSRSSYQARNALDLSQS